MVEVHTVGNLSDDDDDDGNENVTKQKGLMSRTMVMHVRYKPLSISLRSSANQRREMTKFYVV